MKKRLHVTESVERLGGVESLIHQILINDPDSSVVGILDRKLEESDNAVGLRRHLFSSAWSVRKSVRKHHLSSRSIIWHNFAGLTMIGSVMNCDQSILFLHTNSDDIFNLIPARLPYIHGILTSGEDLKNELHTRIPSLQVPVIPLELPLPENTLESRIKSDPNCVVVGYAGRLEITQKKVLRIHEFCRALDATGINFQLEILGSGSAEKSLRKILKKWNPSFFGRRAPEEVMNIYRKWDYSFCCSDYETGPLSILEGMLAGALPVLPMIPCQAANVLKGLKYPLYTPGNMIEAATIISTIEQDRTGSYFRDKLSQAMAHRTPARFIREMNEALEVISLKSRKVIVPPILRGFKEHLPFMLRSRLSGKSEFLK